MKGVAEINLAPGTEYAGLLRRRRRRVVLWTFLIGIVTAAAWGGLFIYQQQLIQEKRDADRRLSAVEAEITRLGDQGQRITLFENRLLAVDSLLSEHISWDPFLQDLERLLPPPAVVNRLEVNVGDNSAELSGQTPDLDIIAQTLASVISTPARPTIFTAANLENVNRVQQDSPEGEVLSVHYEFAAKLSFDSSKIRHGQ